MSDHAIIHQPLLKLSVLALAALALAWPGRAAAQPNVLLIVTDDQRWDTLPYMPTVKSELVGKGITFSNAFTVNPVCCPSRSSILTGTWTHTHRVWGIAPPLGGFARFSDGSTLPVWLDAAGYQTMLAGKYLNGYTDAGYRPPGWDDWVAFTSEPNAYFGYGITDDTGGGAIVGTDESDYATDVLANRAVGFIRTTGPEPFFLYFAPKAPHYPSTPAPRHEGALSGLPAWRTPAVNERNVRDKPAHIRRLPRLNLAGVARERQKQLESLLAVDDAVAAMLSALEETGKLTDTLIIYTSDNGLAWGEHRREHKLVPYEESIRVPLVVRWDALAVRPRTFRRLALNVDIAPTITAAARVRAPTRGRNLLRLILGRNNGWRGRFLFEHYMPPKWGVPAYCAFRGTRWKYVQYATGEEELYNLRRDPHELRNGTGWHPRLIRKFRRQVRRSDCRPPGFQPLVVRAGF